MCRHKSSEIAAGFGRTQIPRNLSYSSHIPGVQQENTHTNKRFKSFQHTFTLCDLLWWAHFTWRTQQHLPGHPPPPHVPLAPFRDLLGMQGMLRCSADGVTRGVLCSEPPPGPIQQWDAGTASCRCRQGPAALMSMWGRQLCHRGGPLLFCPWGRGIGHGWWKVGRRDAVHEGCAHKLLGQRGRQLASRNFSHQKA